MTVNAKGHARKKLLLTVYGKVYIVSLVIQSVKLDYHFVQGLSPFKEEGKR